jgi:hypothetical protein
MSKTICDKDSVHNLLSNVVALGCYIGPRLREYAQTTQDKVGVHIYPSGTTAVKAFVAKDFIFYDKKQCTIKILYEASLNKAALVIITWQIQITIKITKLSCLPWLQQTPTYILYVAQCKWYYELAGFTGPTIRATKGVRFYP